MNAMTTQGRCYREMVDGGIELLIHRQWIQAAFSQTLPTLTQCSPISRIMPSAKMTNGSMYPADNKRFS